MLFRHGKVFSSLSRRPFTCAQVPEVGPSELRTLLQSSNDVILVDVRNADEQQVSSPAGQKALFVHTVQVCTFLTQSALFRCL